jgi:hypothetical protein
MFDKNYPVYIGMSKSAFTEMRRNGRLYNVRSLKFTDSMEEAEKNAREEGKKVEDKTGIVVKFETNSLFSNIIFSDESLLDVIEGIFKFVLGFYEIEVLIVVVDGGGGEYC